jgi:hypothetical protein
MNDFSCIAYRSFVECNRTDCKLRNRCNRLFSKLYKRRKKNE